MVTPRKKDLLGQIAHASQARVYVKASGSFWRGKDSGFDWLGSIFPVSDILKRQLFGLM